MNDLAVFDLNIKQSTKIPPPDMAGRNATLLVHGVWVNYMEHLPGSLWTMGPWEHSHRATPKLFVFHLPSFGKTEKKIVVDCK